MKNPVLLGKMETMGLATSKVTSSREAKDNDNGNEPNTYAVSPTSSGNALDPEIDTLSD
jgi:hypothetical protein